MDIKCEICEKEFKNLISLTGHITKYHKISCKSYYDQYLKIKNEEKCDYCTKETKFRSIKDGYSKYCSNYCSNNSNDVKTKRKETNLKKYGVSDPNKLDEITEKRKNTFLKKYNVDNPLKLKEVKEKIKQTNLDKYGEISSSKNIDIKEKVKQTCLKKYGVDNPAKLQTFKNKIIKTWSNNYGVSHISKLESVKNKKKYTCLRNYGSEYPLQNSDILQKSKNKYFNNFLEKLNLFLNYLDLELLDNEYHHAHYWHNWRCTNCNQKFQQMWNEIQQGYLCPNCYPRNNGTSKAEYEISEFIQNLGFEVIQNSKQIISPFELDIYIPNKNIAIEFNGLYWHSNLFNSDPNYHLNKTKLCEQQGIQLIHIFEDEWLYKQEIVKSKLRQILEINNYIGINENNCYIQEIDTKIKNQFLEQFHLKGKDKSVIKLGAFHNNKLISVMTFSKGSKSKESVWELVSFCLNYNYNIYEISSKLLEYFTRNYYWEEIYLYIDRRWSIGNLYKQIGFKFEYYTKPNCWYINNSQRVHKSNLKEDIEQGYHRIWDCGNTKFKLRKEQIKNKNKI